MAGVYQVPKQRKRGWTSLSCLCTAILKYWDFGYEGGRQDGPLKLSEPLPTLSRKSSFCWLRPRTDYLEIICGGTGDKRPHGMNSYAGLALSKFCDGLLLPSHMTTVAAMICMAAGGLS